MKLVPNLNHLAKSTVKKIYLPNCYEEKLENIRAVCDNKEIWVSVDETTNSTGRKVGNLVIGVLKSDETVSDLSFLIPCKEVSVGNHITVVTLFNESMYLLWSKNIKYNNILFFITEAASYSI